MSVLHLVSLGAKIFLLTTLLSSTRGLSEDAKITTGIVGMDALLKMGREDFRYVPTRMLEQHFAKLQSLNQQELAEYQSLMTVNDKLCRELKTMEKTCAGHQYLIPSQGLGGVHCGSLKSQLEAQKEKTSDAIYRVKFKYGAGGTPKDPICFRLQANSIYISDKICRSGATVKFFKMRATNDRESLRVRDLTSLHLVSTSKQSKIMNGVITSTVNRPPNLILESVSVNLGTVEQPVYRSLFAPNKPVKMEEPQDADIKTMYRIDPIGLRKIGTADGCMKTREEIRAIRIEAIRAVSEDTSANE